MPVATLVGLAGWTGVSVAQEKKPEPPKVGDIVSVANNTANAITFCELLESAGLVDTLRGKEPNTVFVPTDEAFEKLGKELAELQKPENKAELQRVLKNHMVAGRKLGAEVKTMKSVKTLAGDEVNITVTEDQVKVGAAKLVKADIAATNGIIHMIDAVLMPAPQP